MDSSRFSDNAEVFAYSVGSSWVFWVVIVFIFYAAGIDAFSRNPPNVAAGIFLLVLPSLLIPGQILRYARPRLRKAIFYEDYMTLVGRHLRRDVGYSHILQVNVARELLSIPHTELLLDDETDPLVIIKNPTNKNRGVDLVTWLREKAIQKEAL